MSEVLLDSCTFLIKSRVGSVDRSCLALDMFGVLHFFQCIGHPYMIHVASMGMCSDNLNYCQASLLASRRFDSALATFAKLIAYAPFVFGCPEGM